MTGYRPIFSRRRPLSLLRPDLQFAPVHRHSGPPAWIDESFASIEDGEAALS